MKPNKPPARTPKPQKPAPPREVRWPTPRDDRDLLTRHVTDVPAERPADFAKLIKRWIDED
jgi:hypothetical protein